MNGRLWSVCYEKKSSLSIASHTAILYYCYLSFHPDAIPSTAVLPTRFTVCKPIPFQDNCNMLLIDLIIKYILKFDDVFSYLVVESLLMLVKFTNLQYRQTKTLTSVYLRRVDTIRNIPIDISRHTFPDQYADDNANKMQ